MDIRIEKAQSDDAAGLSDFVRELGLFSQINAEPPEQTLEHVLHHLVLCTSDDSHTILIARTPGNEIVGFCSVHWLPYLILGGPEGYISELFVKETFRGHGIGGRLLDAIKTEAQRRGCARLMLINLRKRESYQRQFYAKQGWDERVDAANFILPLGKASP